MENQDLNQEPPSNAVTPQIKASSWFLKVLIPVSIIVVVGCGATAYMQWRLNKAISENPVTVRDSNQQEGEVTQKEDKSPPNLTCDGNMDQPVIISLSQQASPIGMGLNIGGCNLSGFEGDKDIWIESRKTGEKAIVHGDYFSSTGTSIFFKLGSYECSQNTGYTGDRCPSYVNLIPGEYKFYVMPWGKKSNEIPFTIVPSGQLDYAAAVICCKVTDRNFTPDRVSYNWAVGADCDGTAERSKGYLIGETAANNQCSESKPDGVSF